MASTDTKQRSPSLGSSKKRKVVEMQDEGARDGGTGGRESVLDGMDEGLLEQLMQDETTPHEKKMTGTISSACKLANKVKTPFVLHTTTRELLSFLSRMSSMLEQMLFHINTTNEGSAFLEVKVVHPSKVCAVHAKFHGIHIWVDPNVKVQPLIKVSVQHLLNNCELKIPSSPAQLIFDQEEGKLILVCVSQRTTFTLYTPTMHVDEELPKIELAEAKVEYALSVPLSVFRGGIKASSLKKENAIQLTLIKTTDHMYCLGIVHEDMSTIFISLNKAEQTTSSTSSSGTVHKISWDTKTAETPDFDTIDVHNAETLFAATAYSVSYLEKFLSSARGSTKTIQVKLASCGPLFLQTGSITFLLSSYVNEDSSDEEENDEEENAAEAPPPSDDEKAQVTKEVP